VSEAGVAGTVVFQGLVEGPTAAWNPAPDEVADALRARGLPADLLSVLIEGGRAILQPQEHAYPRAQFAADPADALALALQDLFQERPQAADAWFSSLRAVAYAECERSEALLQLASDGVHVVRRVAPWSPPPPATLFTRLRANWLVLALAAIGALAMLWLQRDFLREKWDYWFGGLFGG
jgi:hypothetical protein